MPEDRTIFIETRDRHLFPLPTIRDDQQGFVTENGRVVNCSPGIARGARLGFVEKRARLRPHIFPSGGEE
jgi:hypothetical protein